MFSIFNSQQEYYSCEWLEYGIHFSPFGLEPCCMYVPDANYGSMFVPLKSGEYNLSDFYKRKKKIIEQHKKGYINSNCIKCYNLKKIYWEKSSCIKHIVLDLNYKCNADCIYCFTHKNKYKYNKIVGVPVLDILKKMIKRGTIKPDCEIHISGGEPTLNCEFEEIIKLFLKNNFNNIRIYSSGLEYSEIISTALHHNACKLIISTDSGDRILLKKIKNIDLYDKLWENIQKYCNSQESDKTGVWLKYIIIPNINDNIDAINNFLLKVKEANGKFIVIEIERVWYNCNRKNDMEMKRILKLVKYIQIKSQNIGFEHDLFPSCIYAIDDYHSIYDSLEIEI